MSGVSDVNLKEKNLIQQQTNRSSEFHLVSQHFQFSGTFISGENGDIVGFLISNKKKFSVGCKGKISRSVAKRRILLYKTNFSILLYFETTNCVGFSAVGGVHIFSVRTQVNVGSAVFLRAVGYQRCFLNYSQFSVIPD